MANLVKTIIGGDDFLTEVLVRGLTVHGPAGDYCVGHCNEPLGNQFQARYGVKFVKNFIELIPNSAIVFLAFNAEDANGLLARVAEKVNDWTLIVSCIHGLKLDTLQYFFQKNEIVRLAINPSVVSGDGLGAYALSKNASADANSMAQIVLKSCGEVIAVKNEYEFEEISNYLTANTYLSYVVIQSMIKNAKQVGLSPKDAARYVKKLLQGSLTTLIDHGNETSDLIRRATSIKDVQSRAVTLMDSYGMTEDLKQNITAPPEPEPEIDPSEDPKNFRMHYFTR